VALFDADLRQAEQGVRSKAYVEILLEIVDSIGGNMVDLPPGFEAEGAAAAGPAASLQPAALKLFRNQDPLPFARSGRFVAWRVIIAARTGGVCSAAAAAGVDWVSSRRGGTRSTSSCSRLAIMPTTGIREPRRVTRLALTKSKVKCAQLRRLTCRCRNCCRICRRQVAAG